MSKEYKLVFSPDIEPGELLSKDLSFKGNENIFMRRENGTYTHVSNTEKEHDFNIGDTYYMVGINIPTTSQAGDRTLIKIL